MIVGSPTMVTFDRFQSFDNMPAESLVALINRGHGHAQRSSQRLYLGPDPHF